MDTNDTNDFNLSNLNDVDYIVHRHDIGDKNCIFGFKQGEKYVKLYSKQNYHDVKNEINKNTNLKFTELVIGRGLNRNIALINCNNILENNNIILLEDGSSVLQIVFKSFARVYADYNSLQNR